jgi:iron(III) transport system permease protein
MGAHRAILVVAGGIPLLLVVTLLATIGYAAFRVPGAAGFTLSNFREVYSDPFIYKALLNTIVFAVIAVLTAVITAVPIAWLTERSDLPARGMIFPLMTLSLLIPGFATAMGWLVLLHERVGIISHWISSLFSLERSPINVNNVIGMGFVQGLTLTGLMFIMIASSFRAMDPALEESAEAHGLSLATRLRKVTFPLMWPSILAASLYTLTVGFGSFDIPAVIGMGSNVFVFSTLVYEQARPEGGIPHNELAAATSFLLFFVAILFSYWYLRVVRQSSRYAVVTGKGYRPKLVSLTRTQRVLGWTFVGIVVLLAAGLPFLALLWTSLNRYFVLPSMSAFQNLTLEAYRTLSLSFAGPAIENTIILIFVVPTLTAIFSLAISWVIVRSELKGISGAYDALAFTPHAIPSIILALGAVVIGLWYVPASLPFYGTLNILLAVYIVTWLGFGTRVYNSALLQIHRELDEAGSVFGLKRLTVLRKILLPLIVPAVIYTWVWVALLVYRELTVAAFLASQSNVVLSTFVWQQWQQDTSRGAALSIVMILAMMPLIAIYFWAGRRMASRKS